MNANFTPLGPIKRWPPIEVEEQSRSEIPSTSSVRSNAIGREIGIQGEVLARQSLVTGACRRCGFVGHLPFQCRNFIQLKPNQKTDIDISSTSSEEFVTPLTAKEGKKAIKKMKKDRKKELKKLEKKMKKELKQRKRKRSSSTSSSSSSKAERHKRKKKRRKGRRRESSSS